MNNPVGELPLTLIDMHAHLLPGVDDGCKDASMAFAMLRQAYDAGVDIMVCTPHYYPVESIATFLDRRDAAICALQQLVKQADFPCPELRFGAEVAYYPGISTCEDLDRLCISGTDYLLLEMPFRRWTNRVINEIKWIQTQLGIHVIIAHIERYLKYVSRRQIEALRALGVIGQLNASSLLDWKRRIIAKRLIRDGFVSLLGSDTHNTTTRPQSMGRCLLMLEKRGLQEIARELSAFSASLFDPAAVPAPTPAPAKDVTTVQCVCFPLLTKRLESCLQ